MDTPNRQAEAFMGQFRDPKWVGSSEYHALHELIDSVVASAAWDGVDLTEAVLGALDELEVRIADVRGVLTSGTT